MEQQPIPKREWSRPDTRPLTEHDGRADVPDTAVQNAANGFSNSI